MSKNESNADYTEPVTTYLEPKMFAALEKKASDDERSLSSILRFLIKKYVAGDLEFRKSDND